MTCCFEPFRAEPWLDDSHRAAISAAAFGAADRTSASPVPRFPSLDSTSHTSPKRPAAASASITEEPPLASSSSIPPVSPDHPRSRSRAMAGATAGRRAESAAAAAGAPSAALCRSEETNTKASPGGALASATPQSPAARVMDSGPRDAPATLLCASTQARHSRCVDDDSDESVCSLSSAAAFLSAGSAERLMRLNIGS